MRKLLLLGSVVFVASVLGGCASDRHYGGVYHGQPYHNYGDHHRFKNDNSRYHGKRYSHRGQQHRDHGGFNKSHGGHHSSFNHGGGHPRRR